MPERPTRRPPRTPTVNRSLNVARPTVLRPTLRVTTAAESPPLPKSNFRVWFGTDEIDVASVSPLHLPDGKQSDPEIRQTVTLRRAVGTSRAFYDWTVACRAGKNDVRAVTIALLDRPDGKPAGLWVLAGARAVRWTGPDFDALANGIAMEEVEIAYEAIEWRART